MEPRGQWHVQRVAHDPANPLGGVAQAEFGLGQRGAGDIEHHDLLEPLSQQIVLHGRRAAADVEDGGSAVGCRYSSNSLSHRIPSAGKRRRCFGRSCRFDMYERVEDGEFRPEEMVLHEVGDRMSVANR